MGETMTQKTQEAIKFAQHWLGLAGKHGDPNAPTTVCIVDLAKAVVELSAELAALKDKARWRKQSEEPAPKNQLVEVCESAKDGYIDSTYGFGVEDWVFWRPLDLPEMRKTK